MSMIFSLTKEEMEKHASIVWGMTIDKLRMDGVISKEDATEYLDYTVVIVTEKSIGERLRRFFQPAPEGRSAIKFKVVNMREDLHE